MTVPKINWLAVYAIGIGAWSVVSNSELAFSMLWFLGLFVGITTTLAWLLDKRIGLWLVGLSAILLVTAMVNLGARSAETLAATSGACAGMILSIVGKWMWKRAKPH